MTIGKHLPILFTGNTAIQATPDAGPPEAPLLSATGVPEGRLIVVGATPRPTGPVTNQLSKPELAKLYGVGGSGIKGLGALTGRIDVVSKVVIEFGVATMADAPVLITANRGTGAEVTFALDLPLNAALAMRGQNVTLSGEIEKFNPTEGAIAKVVVEETDGFAPWSWQSVEGKIEARSAVTVDGEAAPAGSWLALDPPIIVAGTPFASLFVGRTDLVEGMQVALTGRLDPRSGATGDASTPYVELSGVTNQTAKEPRWSGRMFTDADDKPLIYLSYDESRPAGQPATIWVLDQGADKAWLGRMGGSISSDKNQFHGFYGSRPIANPTAADRRKIDTNPVGQPVDHATGKVLELIYRSEQSGDVIRDGMTTSWYRNPNGGDLYRLQTGGIAGHLNEMDQIIRR